MRGKNVLSLKKNQDLTLYDAQGKLITPQQKCYDQKHIKLEEYFLWIGYRWQVLYISVSENQIKNKRHLNGIQK